jgi:hypothetical protein
VGQATLDKNIGPATGLGSNRIDIELSAFDGDTQKAKMNFALTYLVTPKTQGSSAYSMVAHWLPSFEDSLSREVAADRLHPQSPDGSIAGEQEFFDCDGIY